jgi:hypothetical protein
MHTTQKQGITRRKFLQKTLALGTALSLETLLGGCATLHEPRQEVRNQQWDCNPVLPIPEEGCYVGFHYLGGIGPAFTNKFWKDKIGKTPSIVDVSASKFGAIDTSFPQSMCESYIQEGIIPAFKYGMTLEGGIEDIATGKTDQIIKQFAKQARDFGKPFIFVPFKEMNWQSNEYWNHGGEPPKTFVKAWRHMHKIFQDIGANKNTIWAIHYLNSYGSHRAPLILPKYYYPGDEYVDIISFTVCNRVGVGEQYRTFGSLIGYDYDWLRSEHKKKPIAILEMSQSDGPQQHKWIKDTYTEIKNDFPAIKIAQWYEAIFYFSNWSDDMGFSNNPKSVQAMKQALSDPYYIGGPLKFLEKYKTPSK